MLSGARARAGGPPRNTIALLLSGARPLRQARKPRRLRAFGRWRKWLGGWVALAPRPLLTGVDPPKTRVCQLRRPNSDGRPRKMSLIGRKPQRSLDGPLRKMKRVGREADLPKPASLSPRPGFLANVGLPETKGRQLLRPGSRDGLLDKINRIVSEPGGVRMEARRPVATRARLPRTEAVGLLLCPRPGPGHVCPSYHGKLKLMSCQALLKFVPPEITWNA